MHPGAASIAVREPSDRKALLHAIEATATPAATPAPPPNQNQWDEVCVC